jgi:hypothetical protein
MMTPTPSPTDPLSMQPEDRLCLLLARGRLTPRQRSAAVALLEQPLDWEHFARRAREHEVYPLAFRNLRVLGGAAAPHAILSELEGLSRMNGLRASLLAEELSRLLEALSRAGVNAIPFKGPHLAERLYGDRTLRVCADLDVLVPRESMAAAVATLRLEGYAAEFSPWFLRAPMLRNNFEYPLRRSARGGDIFVELHWNVLWNRSADTKTIAALWEAATPARFAGAPAYDLSPEWEFLFLAAHAARHNWQGLKWLVDLDEFLARQIDWPKVHMVAARLGWERLVQEALGVCQALYGTPPPAAASLPARVRWYPAAPATPTPWQNTLLCLSLARGPVEWLRVLLRRIFIPNLMDGERWRLPVPLGFLYYVLRPLRLAFDAMRRPGGVPHASEASAAAVPAIQEKR